MGLYLPTTTSKMQVVTTTTAGIDVYAGWADVTTATGAVDVDALHTKITTAATTDVVPVPTAGKKRRVQTLTVANVDAAASNVVTIQITNGTTVVQLESVTLLAGERIAYREGIGTRVIDAAGMEKANAPIAVGQYSVGTLITTFTNATTTAAKVTGLDMVCGPGSWIFEYFLRVRVATALNGPKFSCNHSGTVTAFMATFMSLTTNATDVSGTVDQDVLGTTAPGAVGGVAQRAKSTAAGLILSTAGFDTAAADNMIYGQGMMVVTVSGNLELYAADEAATQMSVEAGSIIRATKAA